MKTLLTLCLALLGSPAVAVNSADDQLRTFAACAGRLSARMEWQWMFDGDGSERTQEHREVMLTLLDASMSADQGRTVLSWRIDAKVAHSSLLTRGTFNDDEEDAAWAMSIAEDAENQCIGLLLS